MRSYIKDKSFPTILILALIGIFSLDAALFNSFGYSSGMIFSLLIVILSVFLTVEKTYYLVIFSFPFTSLLKLSAYSISIVPVIYLIIILKLAILKKKLKRTPLIAFCLLLLIQCFDILLYQTAFSGVFSFLLSSLFVLYSISYFSSEEKCNQLMLKNSSIFLAIAVGLNILLSDIFPNIAYIVSPTKQAALVADGRFGALFVEPNELSQVVLVAIGFLIATFSSHKTKYEKIVIVTIALYLGINGIRSNSKSYVLTLLGLLCVLMFIYVIRFLKNKKTPTHLLVFFIILLLGLIAGFYLITEIIIPVFEFRGRTYDVLTGRGNIWKTYAVALLQRFDVLLIGCGAGNVTGVLRLSGITHSTVPHNFYLEYVVQFGIIGLVLLFLSWSEAFIMIRRKSIWFMIPALAFFITSMSISANSNDCIFILMIILSMPNINMNKRNIPKGERLNVEYNN